ncbi:MAG TPA: twin transmembrane helix small protein [Acidiferrobacterales bacterium]|nr:twin transmembrane helix small protein [Acidiferrobacterales bacterium]
MFFKIIVITVLVLIVTSLFSALVFMYKDKGRNERMVQALTARIILSIALFLFLMAAFYFGFVPLRQ